MTTYATTLNLSIEAKSKESAQDLINALIPLLKRFSDAQTCSLYSACVAHVESSQTFDKI